MRAADRLRTARAGCRDRTRVTETGKRSGRTVGKGDASVRWDIWSHPSRQQQVRTGSQFYPVYDYSERDSTICGCPFRSTIPNMTSYALWYDTWGWKLDSHKLSWLALSASDSHTFRRSNGERTFWMSCSSHDGASPVASSQEERWINS